VFIDPNASNQGGGEHMSFTKVLVANRGEIAVRTMRTARAQGYRTVAVYSTADVDAPHVAAADEAVCIGPPPATESYLNIDAILDACKRTGADAVHPGYGFLSENAAFARACKEHGIVFIGPPAEAIELMGLKREAKLAVMAADVPCVPGYEGQDQDDQTLIAEAEKIGLPVMVKASAGGGGRGMRLVDDAKELPDAIRSARSEATSSFGSGDLILEKAVVEPRHVEIQVFADQHGNAIHLGERDCSVQRRHQKIVEESPSPAVDETIRQQMGHAAVNAAKACNYVGAGTVEFLLDKDGNFYFLEMNTRLQVEHPVTELVTGLDLVAWQLAVAAGEPLPRTQAEVTLAGHAIEVRLYAEDPAQNFLPQTGPVIDWRLPQGIDDLRVDHAVRVGNDVTAHYDPMLAKIIAYGEHREAARRKLVLALAETTLLGTNTNKGFLVDVLAHDVFAAGDATTAFIGTHMSAQTSRAAAPAPADWALAAMIAVRAHARGVVPDASWIGWRANAAVGNFVRLRYGDLRRDVEVRAHGRGSQGARFEALVADPEHEDDAPARLELEVRDDDGCTLTYVLDDVQRRLPYAVAQERLYLACLHGNAVFVDLSKEAAGGAGGAGSGILTAPMDGSVVEVLVDEGAVVEQGQLVAVVEAMKMEHPLKADIDGKVAAVKANKGDQVKTRQVIVEITADEA